MSDILIEKASFVALWVETVFYGIYVVLFSVCIYILLYKQGKTAYVSRPTVLATTALFTMSTIHMVVDLIRAVQAFFDPELDAHTYYEQIWDWLSIFKQALYATNNIVADGLVVYRCYIVWGHNIYIIIFPVVMLVATTVCGYLAVFNFSQVHPGDNVFTSKISDWGKALFGLSLGTNLIVTTLIAVRIWWIARQASCALGRRHAAKYWNTVAIIIESGAIYSVSVMTLLILYCSRTNAQYIVYDSLAQIMGIVPTLIVVRVGLGISTQDVTSYATTAFGHPGHRGGGGARTPAAGTTFALPSLNLNRGRSFGADLESTAYDEAESDRDVSVSVSVSGAGLVRDKAAAERERCQD